MSQYETNANVVQKPGIVEKVKLKAEGLVDKITGHGHTGTTTGVGGAGTTTTGLGGAGSNISGGGAGYGHHQPGYGDSQQLGTNTGYAEQQPLGHHNHGLGATGTTDAAYGQPQHHGHHGHGLGATGTTDAAYGQPQHHGVVDKVKDAVTPGHQSDTVGAGYGTGTGTGIGTGTGTGYGTGTGTDYSSNTASGTTGLSLTDKIKNKLPGHHHTTGTGAGYDNQGTY